MQGRRLGLLLLGLALLVTAGSAFAADEEPLRVALTGRFPPFSLYDQEGELAGFDVDVARAVARKMGREVEFVATEWDGILAGLLAGKYDAIISSMAITPERAEAVDFSTPYYRSGAQLFVHEDDADTLRSIDDLAGKRVGVGLGETYEHYVRTEHPEVEVVTYKGTTDIFQDMLNRRIDGFVTDRLVGLWQIQASDGRFPFVPAGDLLYTERIAIPVRKDRPALLAEINDALRRLRQSGELDNLFEKYFGEGAASQEISRISTGAIVRKLAYGFAITLLVAAASILIGFLLAIPVGAVLRTGKGPVHFLLRAIVDFLRGTPVLIQLFFVYFGLPQVGITLSPITSAIVTLSVNTMAYMAEVIRAGLMSVDPGQALAARALGLTRLQAFRLVVWPQAFRVAIPPLINSVVALTKDTALISIISVGEVIREAQSIISVTFDPMKYYLIAALLFFAVTYPLMRLAKAWEARIEARGFAHD